MKIYEVKIVGYRSYVSKKDGKKRYIWYFVSVNDFKSDFSDGQFTGQIFMNSCPDLGDIVEVCENNGYWFILDRNQVAF